LNPTSHLARRAAATAALACAAALAAGCSSSSTPAAAPTVRVTVTVAPATPSQVPSPQAPAVSPTTQAAPPGPPPCATSDLKVSLGAGQGTAGSVYTTIDFTNNSTSTCTLYGYPGVSLAGGKPVKQIGKAAKEDPATPRQLVTLQPGVTGNALLRIVDALNYPKSTCGPVAASYLQVYPPNQTTPVYLAYHTTACTKPVKLLLVDVVKPGSGSS
jgi:hypothetical protein